MASKIFVQFSFLIVILVSTSRGWFFGSSSSQQQPKLDLSESEVYEHPLSVAARSAHNDTRPKRQAYPVFSPSGAGGLTIESQRDDGPWGEWQTNRSCSMTCGGGVHIEQRTCQGSGCVGPHKRYVSCNTDPCPEDAMDARDAQCSKYDDKPFEGRYLKWKAYRTGPNKCELNCIPTGYNFFFKFANHVLDGTKCDDMSSDDICVEGTCMPLGCDGKLGSSTKRDKCLVCGGQNTACKTMQGVFDQGDLSLGYHDVITIPTGAMSVVVQEHVPQALNYLTLHNESGHYFLNGDYRIDFPNTMRLAGTLFEYERKNTNGRPYERITAKGPLTEPIVIGILIQVQVPMGAQYEYSISLDESQPHIYSVDAWGPCSVECGQGVKERRATCVDSLTKSPVAEELCVNASLPALNRTCNTKDCEAEWYTGPWEECSATCGPTGLQYRTVYCHQVFADGSRKTVNDSVCKAERPPVKQSCNRFVCPEWQSGPWSSCSKPCGEAQQYRAVMCRSQRPEEEGKYLAAKMCNDTLRPEEKRICNLGPCEGLRWVTSEWKLCDRCNDTTENRNVTCQDASGRPFPGDKCPGKRPADSRECATMPPCVYRWTTTQWSECSTECGHGHQTRGVYCTYEYNRRLELVDDFHCNPEMKVPDRQNCTHEGVCTGDYYTSQWSKCTAKCAGGTQNRTILCLDYDYRVRPELCDEMDKPMPLQDCNTEACTNCSDTDFGCCPDNVTIALGVFSAGCSNCSTSEFGCCPDNVTEAGGPNFENCTMEMVDEGSGDIDDITKMVNKSCSATKFGCCQDGMSAAAGPVFEGCLCKFTNIFGDVVEMDCGNMTLGNDTMGNDTMSLFNETDANQTIHCSKTDFGCCPDWYTPADGPDFFGCPVIELGNCTDTKYGCCDDGLTIARGPNLAGCGTMECSASLFGCCKDRRTIAFGPHYKGCERSTLTCEKSEFGCCPDGETAALGRNGRGCAENCLLSKYGCCPDGNSSAKGPRHQGCGCVYSQFGCCPDGIHPATAPNSNYGCPPTCASSIYGCCPDGKTEARGPDFVGCHCRFTSFGCCPDGETPAHGLNNEMCDDCRYAKHGCCLDGVSKAHGPNYAGCIIPTTPPRPTDPVTPPYVPGPVSPEDIAACALEFDQGEVCNGGWKSVWFFDKTYSSCRQHWYGGCRGNRNRFNSEQQCRYTCVEPIGNGVCYLPRLDNQKLCEGRTPVARYSYDRASGNCDPFWYYECSGGNGNNFVDYYDCLNKCRDIGTSNGGVETHDTRPTSDPHEDPHRTPYPDNTSPDQEIPRPHSREICGLHVDTGTCTEYRTMWYYRTDIRSCDTFTYGGCRGNENRFSSREECDQVCFGYAVEPEPQPRNPCDQPLVQGTCGNRLVAYYYDKARGECLHFEYSGCGANENNFPTQTQCEAQCVQRPKPQPKTDIPQECTHPKDAGGCDQYVMKWFYNSTDGVCTRFYYGGCNGNTNRFDTQSECQRQCADKVDPCALPVIPGPCSSREERFYYDQHRRACETFTFGGCLGNTNNFRTFQECQSRCNLDEHGNVPLNRPGLVSASVDQTRPSQLQNVVQAESEGICNQPSERGPCSGDVPKFYFDAYQRRCLRFSYGGCDGNRNRFDTLEECQARCEYAQNRGDAIDNRIDRFPAATTADPITTTSADICTLRPDEGPCRQNERRFYFDLSTGTCHTFTYGGCVGNHNNFGTITECLAYCAHHVKAYKGGFEKPDDRETTVAPFTKKTKPTRYTVTTTFSPPSDLPELCKLPLEPGACHGSILQFYYDWTSGRCSTHYFTGPASDQTCGGNANRFASEEACERACGEYRDQAVCAIAYDEGPCDGRILKWRYDPAARRCRQFHYSGCEGNGNRFSSKEECESLCRQEVSASSSSVVHDICGLSFDSGPCTHSIEQWYYDQKSAFCKPFTYGGCRGNRNRFDTKKECEGRCKNRSPSARLVQQRPVGSSPSNVKPPVVQLIPLREGGTYAALLHCRTALPSKHDKTAATTSVATWHKNGQLMFVSADRRFQLFSNGTLKIKTLLRSDTGNYSCASTKLPERFSPNALLEVTDGEEGLFARVSCAKDLNVSDCKHVVLSDMCRHKYYGPACCFSCARDAAAKLQGGAADKRNLLG